MQVISEMEQMVKVCKKPDDVLAENGLLKQLTKALLQYTLNTQSTPTRQELGYPRFAGFDDKIVSMFALGTDESGIRKRLDFIYGVDLGASLISEATAVLDVQLKALQNRRLERLYPIVTLDTVHVEIAHQAGNEQRAVHVPIGVDLQGRQQPLGFWTSANQDESFWQTSLTGLRNQGVKDIFLLCQDNVPGLNDALHSVYPQAQFHLNIFQMMQASMHYIGGREFKQLGADLRAVYQADTAAEAAAKLEYFASRCDGKHGAVVKLWKDNWERVISFYTLPEELRRALSTMSAIESLHSNLRAAVKKRGSFPNQDEAVKVLYAASQFGRLRWNTTLNWKEALKQYEILWGDRIKSASVARSILTSAHAARAPRIAQSDPPERASASGVSVDFPPPPAR
jgi:putative transposase